MVMFFSETVYIHNTAVDIRYCAVETEAFWLTIYILH